MLRLGLDLEILVLERGGLNAVVPFESDHSGFDLVADGRGFIELGNP